MRQSMSKAATAPSSGEGQRFLSIVDDLVEMFHLLDTAPPEEQAIIREQLDRVAVSELGKKIDSIGFIVKQRCVGEIALLEAFKVAADKKIRFWNNVEESLRNLVTYGLTRLNSRSIKGTLYSFSLSDGRESLKITDEKAVPSQYKTVSVTMPLILWDAAIDSWPPNVIKAVTDGSKQVVSINSAEVKKALQANLVIPGAELRVGDDILTVR